MKSALMLIGACIVILLLPAILPSISDFRSQDYSEDHIVTTNVSETQSEISLSQELYSDATYNAVVTSNISEDAPIPSSYVSATQVLTVTGLEADNTRRLTVDYKIDALPEYPGASVASAIWPLLIIVGVIGIIAGAVYSAVRHGE